MKNKFKYSWGTDGVYSNIGGCEKKPRSEIGKKAYKTFLKNGGKRDSKGRFIKKQQFKWVSVLTGQELKEVVRPKIQVNWVKIGEDIEKAYFNTPGLPINNHLGFAKAYAKVFKKHNLLREGVEI